MTKKIIKTIKVLKQRRKSVIKDMEMTTEPDLYDYYEGMSYGLKVAIYIIKEQNK